MSTKVLFAVCSLVSPVHIYACIEFLAQERYTAAAWHAGFAFICIAAAAYSFGRLKPA